MDNRGGKTIFLVLPRRISVRYLLSVGFLDEFKGYPEIKIVILTSISDPKFAKEFGGENVLIEQIPLRDGKEFWLEGALRQLRNYLGGMAYDLETFDAKAKMRGRLFHAGYRVLVFLSRPLLFLRSWFRAFDNDFFSPLFDGNYSKIFKKYRPDLVVIHSVYELTAVPVARVARRLKVPSLGIVTSWDNLTNKADIYARTDKLVVWSDIMKEQAIRYHNYLSKDVFAFGTPQFDFYLKLKDRIKSREVFFAEKKLDLQKRLIVFTTVPERIGGAEEIEVIKKISEWVSSGKLQNSQLMVRIYSKDRPDRYYALGGLPGLVLDDPRQILTEQTQNYCGQDENFTLDLAAEMKYADVVVNLASTTTIDAAIFNTPIVNLAMGEKQHWNETSHYLYLVKTCGSKLAYNYDDLKKYIYDYLDNPDLHMMERKNLVNTICGPLDGQSNRHLTDLILKLFQ